MTTIDITGIRLLHRIDGIADVTVEPYSYPTEQGPLPFDLYRPARAAVPAPAVIFVNGLPDPGVTALYGKAVKDWASYQDWGRLVAAAGLVGLLYLNREPADVTALVRHVRTNAASLGIDPDRIGVWACSGHVPTALALVARERFACAALLYGYTMDLDGANHVAKAAGIYYFATPPVTLAELPRAMPMLLVRAGRDELPGLDETLQRFVAAARARQLPITLLEHAEAPHAFDMRDDSPRTHEVIDETLAFLRRALV